jgi:hypothetical protein
MWFGGYVFFLLTIAVLLACALYLIIKRRSREIGGLIGINSVEEEINEEVGLEDLPLTGAQFAGAQEK